MSKDVSGIVIEYIEKLNKQNQVALKDFISMLETKSISNKDDNIFVDNFFVNCVLKQLEKQHKYSFDIKFFTDLLGEDWLNMFKNRYISFKIVWVSNECGYDVIIANYKDIFGEQWHVYDWEKYKIEEKISERFNRTSVTNILDINIIKNMFDPLLLELFSDNNVNVLVNNINILEGEQFHVYFDHN